jgi:lantibiotic modifying enzyme
LRHLDDREIATELDIALRTTLASGFGRDHSPCHGDLGNLDLLLSAAEMLDDPSSHTQTQRLTQPAKVLACD